mmetsp:Transcript_57896/g.154707  ORF Transcript_57896/g.154707 Transcript_57896/m.154707 type:complete len:206 (-) Transcript_57896:447-1064(-)
MPAHHPSPPADVRREPIGLPSSWMELKVLCVAMKRSLLGLNVRSMKVLFFPSSARLSRRVSLLSRYGTWPLPFFSASSTFPRARCELLMATDSCILSLPLSVLRLSSHPARSTRNRRPPGALRGPLHCGSTAICRQLWDRELSSLSAVRPTDRRGNAALHRRITSSALGASRSVSPAMTTFPEASSRMVRPSAASSLRGFAESRS